MSAHDKSAIPTDATAVSAITRAQNDSRRWGGTGDIFSKAHLDFFRQTRGWLMTPQLSTGHTITRHVRPVTSFLKRTGAAAERFQRTFSSTMCSTSRDNPRASNEQFCENLTN